MVLRGREFTDSDIEIIRETIATNSDISRRRLSFLISERLSWRQPNGNLKDRACRDVLLRLDAKGVIGLPKPSYRFTTQRAGVKSVNFIEPSKDITGKPSDFDTPVFKIVERSEDRRLWNYLIDRYHYKRCRIIVGRHLKYLLYLNDHLIGCFAFADAVLQLTARDQWIGWTREQKENNLFQVINNVRFLILPWVKIRNLASKLLSLASKIVPRDWVQFYNYQPLLMETFIEKARFTGASYKAANWIYIGCTKGQGRSGQKYYHHGIIKDVYVYPLLPVGSVRYRLTNQDVL